ncbi:MAG: redoxin domain-containing protein [Nitrosopumilus sp.]|nr:redoxin domain-containing protein [Nitrosopumilus sp.]NNL59641.1 redoxin domain-containing protein [Nitrosopumilus sp.]
MQEGQLAPNFTLIANTGESVTLDYFKDKKNIVLCFYPKNHLFGCPSKKVFKMAKSVISAYDDIVSTDTELFAISVDTVENQTKFVKEYTIPYLHLSDTSKETCKEYAGLNFVGLPKRSTFIIDKKGSIRKIFRDIDVEQHGQQIATFLQQM